MYFNGKSEFTQQVSLAVTLVFLMTSLDVKFSGLTS